MTKTKLQLGLTVVGLIHCLAGCDGGPGDASLGSVTAALSSVPAGVTCVQLVLSGSTSSTQSFSVTAGTTPVNLSVGSVPAGNLTVASKAYNLACSTVTGSSAASWVGTNVTTAVTPGQTTQIAITLRENLPVSVQVNFLANAISVAAGDAATYAVLSDGTVRAWGYNSSGQLGDGTTSSRLSPVAVMGLTGIASVTGGTNHACALTSSGQAKCWGQGVAGQLGNGSTTNSSVPVNVAGGLFFRTLAAAEVYTCGATTTGGSACWGDNSLGQFGTSAFTSSSTPVVNFQPVDLVVSGPTAMTTFFFSGNTSLASGANPSGLVGNGSTAASVLGSTTGFTAGGSLFITAAAVGSETFACAIEASAGSLYCAGGNSFGELGNGATVSSSVPVLVSGLSNVTAIAAGVTHACALKSDGSVWCWGNNANGQIGDGTGTNRSVPTAVHGLSSGVTSIATGSNHSCAVKTDGTVWCWGANGIGQAGDGTQINRPLPTKVLL